MEDMKKNMEESIRLENGTEGVEAATSNESEALREQINKLQEELKQANDLYLRALAEADNTRKRAVRERDEYIKFASLPLVKKLLAVIDDLDRAISMFGPEQNPEALLKGVEMIMSRMKEIVEQEGVQALDALGQPFDPQYHQPLTVEANSQYPENTVIEELQKGYLMHDRVIRPSLVKVSK
ncbi:MAG: nucleotide exchange factor GrpE [Syntrophomonadaceae bacterium]|jgi:molecular chaperone GrpE|nr:nucleotide exchange factor GrpE [Syntrophomonadaceae bacterium]